MKPWPPFRLALVGLVGLVGFAGGCAAPGQDSVPDLGPQQSALWGAAGERWTPDSRLPDFSRAGYRAGQEPPVVPVTVDVKDFGAQGDGKTDDTAAFLAAIAALSEAATETEGSSDSEGRAIFIPAGRYVITEPLLLKQSGLVLRGAGPEATVLSFPKPLFDTLGKGPWGGPYGWAWGGGWIWAHGEYREEPPLTQIVRAAKRGENALEVASSDGILEGQFVRLTQNESDGSLSEHLHSGHTFVGPCWIDGPGFRTIDWVFRVDRVENQRIYLDRPLRVDVRPEWNPSILPYHPTVTDVGVEHLALEFPDVEYNGHHLEPGYNGIYFNKVHNSWVRNVAISNFDSGISLWHSRYSTIEGIHLLGRGGHYAINLGASQDCLVTDFKIANRSEHDLSVSNLANGNVFANGTGQDINFDHHRGAPFENLFSNIHVGTSWHRRRLWSSSGTVSGHYTAARETFWNIRPRMSTRWIPAWPTLTVVGPLRQRKTSPDLMNDAHLENVPALSPADLHRAQVERRLDP